MNSVIGDLNGCIWPFICDVNNCRTEESENRSKEYRESRACRAIFEVLSYLLDITLTKIPIKHRLAFLKKVIGRGCDHRAQQIIKQSITLSTILFSFLEFERLLVRSNRVTFLLQWVSLHSDRVYLSTTTKK